jgi:hypothetical protein
VVAVVVGILGVVPVPVGFAAWGIIKCFRHRGGYLVYRFRSHTM